MKRAGKELVQNCLRGHALQLPGLTSNWHLHKHDNEGWPPGYAVTDLVHLEVKRLIDFCIVQADVGSPKASPSNLPSIAAPGQEHSKAENVTPRLRPSRGCIPTPTNLMRLLWGHEVLECFLNWRRFWFHAILAGLAIWATSKVINSINQQHT